MARSIPMLLLLPMLLAVALLAGCECGPSDECARRGDTRCDGSRAEICDADLRWQTFIACDELGPDWVCRYVEDGHTCVPREDGFDGGSR